MICPDRFIKYNDDVVLRFGKTCRRLDLNSFYRPKLIDRILNREVGQGTNEGAERIIRKLALKQTILNVGDM